MKPEIIILQGPPMSGKTMFLRKMADVFDLDPNQDIHVPNLEGQTWARDMDKNCFYYDHLLIDEFSGKEQDWLRLLKAIEQSSASIKDVFVTTLYPVPEIITWLPNVTVKKLKPEQS